MTPGKRIHLFGLGRRCFVLLSGVVFASYASAAGSARFDVRAFGAVGDGVTKDTVAISHAIDACAKAGGGVVEFPAGRYLTGTIRLQSNITLEITPGATILGSPDVADYPIGPNPWGKDDWQGPTQMAPLLHADGADNIALTGGGTIDGQGLIWWKRYWFTESKPNAKRDTSGVVAADAEFVQKHGGRPQLIRLVNCRHVRISDLTLRNSPRWTVHPLFCDHVDITRVTIINPATAPNTDGINPESCRYVHISDCHIDTGDDGITLKSGQNEVGRRKGRPTESVTITNCTFLHAHGGIVIGSEMSGGVRDVAVSNCSFKGTEKGLRIKSNRERGGVVERIRISNLVMDAVVEPINIVMFYFSSDAPGQVFPVGEGTPRFRDIQVSDVLARGAKRAGQIIGLREMPISDLTLRNIQIAAETGFLLQDVDRLTLGDAHLTAKSGPAIKGVRVTNLELRDLRTGKPPPDTPVIELENARGLYVAGARPPEETSIFLRLLGEDTRDVVLHGCDLKGVRQPVITTGGARRESVSEY